MHPKDFPYTAICMFLSLIPTAAYTQDVWPAGQPTEKFSAGLSFGHFSYDPTLVIELTTPSFRREHLRIRLRANIQWLENYETTRHWNACSSYSLAMVYQTRVVERVRFNVELGISAILPGRGFSAGTVVPGYFELNGLEILLTDGHHRLALNLAVGPYFSRSFTDKPETRHSYDRGLQYITGFRFYF